MTNPVPGYAGRIDLAPVVNALRNSQTRILDRWLERVTAEPFHLGRRERAISDHIPALFDALLQSLSDDAPTNRQVRSTFESDAVKAAAGKHALTRRTQGLSVTEVISEIRMLRQETSRALLESLTDDALTTGILGAELALNDGFDGAICVAVDAVVEGMEQEHRDALAITVHDVRTPLAAVKGSAQLARRRAEAPRAEIDQFLDRIVESANRASEIVDEALATVQVADSDQLHPSAISIRPFLHEAISALGAEARSRVRIKVAAGTPKQVVWDVQRLRRTIENIVSNALKYAPTGVIWISAAAAPGDRVSITVKDRGIGLSATDKRKLFARYYRSPEAIRMKIEGTGLGLYVAKATVEAHGGKLLVESAGPGKGTTVHIVLPMVVSGSADARRSDASP